MATQRGGQPALSVADAVRRRSVAMAQYVTADGHDLSRDLRKRPFLSL
jgi:hypothetical protein